MTFGDDFDDALLAARRHATRLRDAQISLHYYDDERVSHNDSSGAPR